VRSKYGSLEGWVSIVVNILLFAVKIGIGLSINSVSLIADAVHTLLGDAHGDTTEGTVVRGDIITGQTVGVLKLLFHRETLQVLGIHCFGANASEIIHIGQAIMAQEGSANSLLYFLIRPLFGAEPQRIFIVSALIMMVGAAYFLLRLRRHLDTLRK